MAVALLSALETRIPWIAELCGLFGGGCRDTASFTLFGVSVAFLGMTYYAALTALVLFVPGRAFRWVMVGAGVELLFLYTMVDQGIFCPFCMLNFLVIVALVALTLDWERRWEALALALLSLVCLSLPFSQENEEAMASQGSVADPAVVARVNGQAITDRDLERTMASRLYDARMGLYVQQRAQIDRMVDDLLLKEEAVRLGITIDALGARIQAEVRAVEPEEVEAFLVENPGIPSTWKGTMAELRKQVRAHLQQKNHQGALKRYVNGLRESAHVEILLQEPPLPFTRVSLGNSPSLGPAEAPVVVVEFSDYLCSACRKAHEITMQVREDYGDRVRWVFKDYPLERHEGARDLAEAARCAGEQDVFWEYQDMLFTAQGEVDRERLLGFAVELGMDTKRFEQCMSSGRYVEDVLADLRSGEEAGVDVTPTFIINGRIRPGTPSPEELRGLIEAELARAAGVDPPP